MSDAALPLLEAPLRLMVTQGPWTGTLIPMKGTQFLIGRGPNCHLRPTSDKIEDNHCGIFTRDGRFFLRDINSHSGTYLNDRQVFGKVQLLDRDELRVGPLRFLVNIPDGTQNAAKN